MKILHLSYSDSQGGAAIAAYRHHEAMLKTGVNSQMLVLLKSQMDPKVHLHKVSTLKMFIKRAFGRIFNLVYPFYATWSWNHYGFDLANDPEVKEADVIILHWINAYTISLKSIEKILNTGKPVFWFMHDMWPITGGCHHSLNCTKYTKLCSRCEMANNHAGSHHNKDLSFFQFTEKLNRLAPHKNLKFITPSQWLADRVKESALFSDHEVLVVRNVLDTNVFKPVDKYEARKRLGLPSDKKLILFGADNISSPYKGWSMLRHALAHPIDGVDAVVYGKTPSDLHSQIGLKLHAMGHINHTSQLIDLYSACDVFVTPSIADNYPNVLIEAMACGLPCVGTNVGGIPEIIKNGKTGLLTPPSNPEKLMDAIISILSNTQKKFDPIEIRNNIIETNGYNNKGLSKFILSIPNKNNDLCLTNS